MVKTRGLFFVLTSVVCSVVDSSVVTAGVVGRGRVGGVGVADAAPGWYTNDNEPLCFSEGSSEVERSQRWNWHFP